MRLLRVLQAEMVGQRAHVRLGEPGVHQGRDHLVVRRRDQPGPVVAQVVLVGAVGDVVATLLGGDAGQSLVKRGLAVEASVHRVGAVLGLGHFVRDDDAVPHAPLRGQLAGEREVAPLEALRAGGDRQRIGPQRSRRHERHQRTVHTAGERDDDAAKGANAGLQRRVFGAQVLVHRNGQMGGCPLSMARVYHRHRASASADGRWRAQHRAHSNKCVRQTAP